MSLHRPRFNEAAAEAARSACLNAHCGAVIVGAGGRVLGRGHNGPPGDLETNRTCGRVYDLERRPKHDLTCCMHAEWTAILNATAHDARALAGSTLYFARVEADGHITDAGLPYCTPCSRLILGAGIGFVALWNAGGADLYDAAEYDQVSYEYFLPR